MHSTRRVKSPLDVGLNEWEEYLPVGDRLPGTRLFCFKAPLSETFCLERNLKRDDWFTPADVVKAVEKRGCRLGLVVSLTPSEVFYDPREFTSIGVGHLSISSSGKGIPSSKTVRRFFDIVEEFERVNTDKDSLIGIHCTTGINRSGFVVCRYLIDKRGKTPSTAVEEFNASRGHQIERSHYIEALFKGESDEPSKKSVKVEPIGESRPSGSSTKDKSKKRRKKDKKDEGRPSKKLKRSGDKGPRKSTKGKVKKNSRKSESREFEEGDLLVLSEAGEKDTSSETESKPVELGVIRVINPQKDSTTAGSSAGLPQIGVRHLLRMGKDERIETVSPFQSATISSTADIVPDIATTSAAASASERERISPAFVPIPAAPDDDIDTSVAVKLLVAESGSAKVLSAEELEDLEDGEVRSDEDEESAKLREQKRKLKKIKSAMPTVKLDEKEKSKNLLYNKMLSQIRTKKMPIGIVIKSLNFNGPANSPQPPMVADVEPPGTSEGPQKVTEEPTSTTGDADTIDLITPNVTNQIEQAGEAISADPSPICYVSSYVPAQKIDSGRVYREVRPNLRSQPVGSSTPINPEALRKHAEPKLPWETDDVPAGTFPYGPPATGPHYVSAVHPAESFPPSFNVPPPAHHGHSSQTRYGGPPPLLTGPNYRGGGLDPAFERYVPQSIRGFDGRQESHRESNRREQQLSGGNAQPLPQHRLNHNQPGTVQQAPPPPVQQTQPANSVNNNIVGALMNLFTQGQSGVGQPQMDIPAGPSQPTQMKNPTASTADANNPMMVMQQLLMQTFLMTACQQITNAAAPPPPVVNQPAAPQLDPMTTLLMTAMLGAAANSAAPTATPTVTNQQPPPVVVPNVRSDAGLTGSSYPPASQHHHHHHSRKRHGDGGGYHPQHSAKHFHQYSEPQEPPRPLLSREVPPPEGYIPSQKLPVRPIHSSAGSKMESSDDEGLVEEEEIVEMPSEKEEGEASDSSGANQSKSQGARRRERRKKLGGKFATMKKGKFWQIYDMQYSKT